MRKIFPIILVISLLTACREQEERTINTNVNSFEFVVNNRSWKPSALDDCIRTFQCNLSKLDGKPFYKIEAYRDSHGQTSIASENAFEVQVMNVSQEGNFIINGSFGGFENYARFKVNENNKVSVYTNEENGNSFHVEVTELIPVAGSNLVGIKGSFYGTLYNVDDPGDSVTIEKGDFTFRKMNWYNFNQCEE